MTEPLLRVDSLSVVFKTYAGPVHAVENVSLLVGEGEILGVVGETGAGKSVLLRALMGIVRHPGEVAAGSVVFRGRDILRLPEKELRPIRGREIALIGSNPKTLLDPLARIGDQLAQVMVSHGTPKSEAVARASELVASVGIPDPSSRVRAYPHELSGGMAQRVIIAMALACSPSLLLADEPTTGLDVTVQVQILDILRDLTVDSGAAAILVTRDLGIVANYCQRVVVMQAGQVVEEARVETLFTAARHPYTLALLDAAFAARGETAAESLTGTAERRFKPLDRCPLADNCPLTEVVCQQVNPGLVDVAEGHFVRCHVRARQ